MRTLLLVASLVLLTGCDAVDTDSTSADLRKASGEVGRGGDRVGVCHRTNGRRDYRRITVATPALDAHLGHGDGLVGGAVPGRPDRLFDPTCEIVVPPTMPADILQTLLDELFDRHDFRFDPDDHSWTLVTTSPTETTLAAPGPGSGQHRLTAIVGPAGPRAELSVAVGGGRTSYVASVPASQVEYEALVAYLLNLAD